MIDKNKLIVTVIAITLFLQACRPNTVPEGLESSMDLAGSNRSEIMAVIDHYSGTPTDSLKLKAALFLIKNLKDRSYVDGRSLRNYVAYPNLVLRDLDHGEYIMRSFDKIYGPYSPDSLKVYRDLQELKSAQMIGNIDAAFDAWQKQPWFKDYTFDQFCNYILPFRIEDEIPCYNRREIFNKYDSLLRFTGSRNLDAVGACVAINNELIKDGWTISTRAAFLPHNPAYSLIENRIGTCREMVDLGTYVMRSVGIPTSSDFIPQWPYRRNGHSWNVIIGKNGKAIPFLGCEDSPGTPHRPNTKKGKVYRLNFTKNPHSLSLIAGPDDYVPPLLSSPYMIDVTDEYARVHAVKIESNVSGNHFLFLSVFDNITWVPVAAAKRKANMARFEKVEGGIVYLPTFETSQGQIPAGFPFLLSEDGAIRKLRPDTSRRIPKMICDRVYPVVPESYHADMATDGVIQVADNKEFQNAVNVYHFSVRAMPGWNEITLKTKGAYRYVRFLSGKQKRCEIAEMQVISDGVNIHGLPIGNSKDPREILNYAFDQDSTTAYSSTVNAGAVGLDMKKPIRIDKVRLMTKIDIPENHLIVPRKNYTLKYWNGSNWRELTTVVAGKKNIEFSNVPANALFLLASPDLADTRIFTYENGRQVWY